MRTYNKSFLCELAFADEALAVGEEETTEVVDAGGDFATFVGLAHHDTLGAHLDEMAGGTDVSALANGVLGAGEGLMLHQLHATRMIDQGVARDARDALIGFRKTAIDDNEFATGLQWALALGRVNGSMAVDDVAVSAADIKFLQYAVNGVRVVAKSIVGAFAFLHNGFVFEEITLEGGHLVLVEQGGILAAPKVPVIIEILKVLAGIGFVDKAVDAVEERTSMEGLALNDNVAERAVVVHRHRCMIE